MEVLTLASVHESAGEETADESDQQIVDEGGYGRCFKDDSWVVLSSENQHLQITLVTKLLDGHKNTEHNIVEKLAQVVHKSGTTIIMSMIFSIVIMVQKLAGDFLRLLWIHLLLFVYVLLDLITFFPGEIFLGFIVNLLYTMLHNAKQK